MTVTENRAHHLLLISLAFFATSAQAQWLRFRDSGTPRRADGKADLSASAPKAFDGKPDLSGVWMHEATSLE
jgi:hypothetical protein